MEGSPSSCEEPRAFGACLNGFWQELRGAPFRDDVSVACRRCHSRLPPPPSLPACPTRHIRWWAPGCTCRAAVPAAAAAAALAWCSCIHALPAPPCPAPTSRAGLHRERLDAAHHLAALCARTPHAGHRCFIAGARVAVGRPCGVNPRALRHVCRGGRQEDGAGQRGPPGRQRQGSEPPHPPCRRVHAAGGGAQAERPGRPHHGLHAHQLRPVAADAVQDHLLLLEVRLAGRCKSCCVWGVGGGVGGRRAGPLAHSRQRGAHPLLGSRQHMRSCSPSSGSSSGLACCSCIQARRRPAAALPHRWWEARTLWGSAYITVRSIMRLVGVPAGSGGLGTPRGLVPPPAPVPPGSAPAAWSEAAAARPPRARPLASFLHAGPLLHATRPTPPHTEHPFCGAQQPRADTVPVPLDGRAAARAGHAAARQAALPSGSPGQDRHHGRDGAGLAGRPRPAAHRRAAGAAEAAPGSRHGCGRGASSADKPHHSH